MCSSVIKPVTSSQAISDSPSNAIWVGVYDNWDQARIEAERRSRITKKGESAFSSSRWLQRQDSILQRAKAGIWDRYSTLPVVATLTKPLSILDFGGGSGWTYWALDEGIRDTLNDYSVVETLETIQSFSGAHPSEKVNFLTIENILERPKFRTSILYANSALQYFPNDEVLRMIAHNCRPDYVLVDDLQIASKTFFSHQRYYDDRIVCRFSRAADVECMLPLDEYKLEGTWPYPKSYSGSMNPQLENETLSPKREIEILPPVTALFSRIGVGLK